MASTKEWLIRFLRKKIPVFFQVWKSIFEFLPVQLIISQIKYQKILLVFWIILTLIVSQNLMKSLGAPYLFLEPEYLNQTDFFAFFIMGFALGGFTLAYHLTSYINDGYKFSFLSLENQPFFTFCVNNSGIPLLFWFSYIYFIVDFQLKNAGSNGIEISWMLFGLCSGGISSGIFASIYFWFTNKNFKKIVSAEQYKNLNNPKPLLKNAMAAVRLNKIHVATYIRLPFRIHYARSDFEGDFKLIVKILNQHHANAVFAAVLFFTILFSLATFSDSKWIQIPAAASFLFLFTFGIMLLGAAIFWFRKMGFWLAFALFVFFWWNPDIPYWDRPHQATGLNYQSTTEYSAKILENFVKADTLKKDSIHQIGILNRWKSNQNRKKPNLIFICTTGGGLRSAYWTLLCLSALESKIPEFHHNIHLITGASGGMLGAAYYRELLLHPNKQLSDPSHADKVSADLLNRICFNLCTQFLIPLPERSFGSHFYPRDRGFAFEEQLSQNTGFWASERISDYYQAEKESKIPMIILTPTITNDGRPLVISPQPVSFLTAPDAIGSHYKSEIPRVEFRRTFQKQDADSLRFSTALRMNATFPYILPFVELPSEPSLEIMDAGVTDNFGIHLAVKYLNYFQQWIKENINSVIVIQIRDSPKEEIVKTNPNKSFFGQMFGVIGETYYSMSEHNDFVNDDLLAQTNQILDQKLKFFELEYIPSNQFEQASLSFHLTNKEKSNIRQSLENPVNQKTLQMILKEMEN